MFDKLYVMHRKRDLAAWASVIYSYGLNVAKQPLTLRPVTPLFFRYVSWYVDGPWVGKLDGVCEPGLGL